MRRGLACFALSALSVSCMVYDASLLEEDSAGLGGEGSNAGQDATDGSGGSALSTTGGASTDSGGDQNTGGGTSTGGSSTGSGSGGNGSGGSGSGGSGGSDPVDVDCSDPGSTKAAFENVGATELIDAFDIDWRQIGDGQMFSGSWFISADSSGSGLSPTVEAWAYDQFPCFTDGDTALHVTGTGYDSWGVSVDATLNEDPDTSSDLSAYDGVTFWARTDADIPDRIRIGITDDTDTTTETSSLTLTAEWKQYLVPFPSANVEKTFVLHIVGLASDEFDFWIDDPSLYQDPT